MRNARLERDIGSAPLRHPDRVTCEVREIEGGAVALEASHDGYATYDVYRECGQILGLFPNLR